MIQLVPMDEAAFSAFLDRAIPRRAARYVARGIWKESHALEASRSGYSRLLPQGRNTPNHHFCEIVEGDRGTRVGEVWYTVEETGGARHFWIEWIGIDPEHRRHGYATSALQLLEEEARKLGADRTGLDVWSDNPGALELYRKLGYAVARMSMVKSTRKP